MKKANTCIKPSKQKLKQCYFENCGRQPKNLNLLWEQSKVSQKKSILIYREKLTDWANLWWRKRNGCGLKTKGKDFIRKKKQMTGIPCLTNFAGERDKMAETDATRNGLGTAMYQKQNGKTFQKVTYASSFLNGTMKKDPVGELEIIAVVWGLVGFTTVTAWSNSEITE